MKHNIHTYIAKTAIDYARITPEEVIDISMRQDGTLVEVDFGTEWMNYICYVDLSGEVFGFSSEPAPLTGMDCAEDSAGMTMAELAALFESLGCKAAYNMDGGQSSVMAWDEGRVTVNTPASGGRPVSDIIYIPKE